jgi:antitoxin component of RelBE/YafQ-DinJ toxin-antitoxin module
MPIQKDAVIMLRLTSTLKRRCESVAKRAGMTPSDWIRAVLAAAANTGALAPPPRRARHGKGEDQGS